MFDAISNFVVYLRECIENSEDSDEIYRLRNLLEKAEQIKEKVEGAAMQRVEA
jgi:hypothetical protein